MRNYFYRFLSSFAFVFNLINKNRLRVLAYHEVKDEFLFEEQIKFLCSAFKPISIEELRKHIFENWPLPYNSILITFDDGDISVLEKGLPVLDKYQCPSCLFIITALINTKKEFWWNKVRKQNDLDSKQINAQMNYIKELPNKSRLTELEKYSDTPQEQLKTEDLKFMERKNMFIANHSHTHPMFNKCTREELEYELKATKTFFENGNFTGYDIFAYPNGNFDEKSEKVLQSDQIKMAFLFDHKICSKEINPMRISRLRVNSDTPIEEFKVKVSGLHSFLQEIKI